MKASLLQLAIERGLRPGGDLADELRHLKNYRICTADDARAICDALATLPTATNRQQGTTSPLHALTGLFQDVMGRQTEAFEVLWSEGIAHLIRLFDRLIHCPEEDTRTDLLFILKILALYGVRDGVEKIIQAARKPLEPDSYMWWGVFSSLSQESLEERAYVFDHLRDHPPGDSIGIALMDCANATLLAGHSVPHPFDSPAGKRRLHDWLTDNDPEHFSRAISVAATLAFISNPDRDQLLSLALDHSDAGVQLEAAWAAARLGHEAGMKWLVRFCLDPNHSTKAQRYLAELGREDAIPTAALEPAFQAKAEFAQWLAHPSELGRPPDELEVIDHRVLAWPPDRQQKELWLIKYRLRDTTGLAEDDVDCGLVGSVTFCLFTYRMHERPIEDAYAIHCCWEMEQAELIQVVDVDDPAEYAPMLKQWRGDPLTSAVVLRVAELLRQLKYPQRMVAMASATLGGEDGWVVLDGPRSTWYPKQDMPRDVHQNTVLALHLGRQLLGFEQEPNRRKYLAKPQPGRDPRQIVRAYEKLLAEAKTPSGGRCKVLLAGFDSPLEKYFLDYAAALADVRSISKETAIIQSYQEMLNAVKDSPDAIQEDAWNCLSPLEKNFDAYVEALIHSGQSDSIPAVIELFAPHWMHNRGYATLGTAAFKASHFDIAEQYFTTLRDSHAEPYSCKEMSLLAAIWFRRHKVAEAEQLLIECLTRLATDAKTAEGSNRKLCEEWYQHHRTTFLRFFNDLGQAELSRHGLPPTTLY